MSEACGVECKEEPCQDCALVGGCGCAGGWGEVRGWGYAADADKLLTVDKTVHVPMVFRMNEYLKTIMMMILLLEYKSVFESLLVALAAAEPGSSVTSFGNKPEHTAEKYARGLSSLPVMFQSLFRNWRNSKSGLEYLRLLHHCILPRSHMHVSQNMNVHLLTVSIKVTLSARAYFAPVDAT